MSVLILYLHLVVIAVVSILFVEALENVWLKAIFCFTEIAALLTAYGYAVWSLVRIIVG